MEKLIPMTSFVLEHSKEFNFNKEDLNSLDKIINYANFLKQPLTLGMFVPCDLDGNIISEKENNFIRKELEEYAEAEKRVLFEGFSIVGEKHVGNKYNVFGIGFKNGHYKIVEDLINRMNSDQYILLTESAKKQIGL